MHRHSGLPLALAALLAGCNAENLTEPVADGALSHAAFAVPFSASCELTIQPPTPVGPGLIHQIDSGACERVTHLGRAAFTSDKVINVVAGTQTLEATFVAANGDVLRGSGTGTSALVGPGRVAFTATLTFAGGTGRFANATGQATITGEADLPAARSHMTATGSILY